MTQKTVRARILRPKKHIPVSPVSLPTLIFAPTLNILIFITLLRKKSSPNKISLMFVLSTVQVKKNLHIFLFHGEAALRKILKFQGETPNFSEKFQGEIAEFLRHGAL